MADLKELKRDLQDAELKIAEILTELENKYGAQIEVTTDSVSTIGGQPFVQVELSMRVGSGG